MKTYQIEQTATAVILWTGEALSPEDALDKMAQAAGYRDHAHACEDTSPDGLEVRAVSEPEAAHGGERIAAEFVAALDPAKMKAKVWSRGLTTRVYLTPTGHRRDAGYLDCSEKVYGSRHQYRMDREDLAAVDAALAAVCPEWARKVVAP